MKEQNEISEEWLSEVAVQSLTYVQLFVTPWIVACQTPLSMWFSRQEYWSGLPFPSPGKWSGDRQFIGNRIQSDDSKDDSRSQKKNGGKDRKYKKYLTKNEKK